MGDEVNVYVNGNKEKAYRGVISEFSPAPAYGTMTYPITVSLDNEGGKLISGQIAEIEIKTEQNDVAICIPSEAVMVKEGVSKVAVLDENDGQFVEIPHGIYQGDRIVISGQDFVNDGDKVRVVIENGVQIQQGQNEGE